MNCKSDLTKEWAKLEELGVPLEPPGDRGLAIEALSIQQDGCYVSNSILELAPGIMACIM